MKVSIDGGASTTTILGDPKDLLDLTCSCDLGGVPMSFVSGSVQFTLNSKAINCYSSLPYTLQWQSGDQTGASAADITG